MGQAGRYLNDERLHLPLRGPSGYIISTHDPTVKPDNPQCTGSMDDRPQLTAFHFRQIHERSDDDSENYDLEERDMVAYNRWAEAEEQRLDSVVWNEEIFVFQILETNFHDVLEVDVLLRQLKRFKGVCMVLGEWGGKGYRLKLGRAKLQATVPTKTAFVSRMPPELLGLARDVSIGTPTVGELRRNTSVDVLPEPAKQQPEDPRKDSIVSTSTSTSTALIRAVTHDTIGNDESGFIFFQLGTLEVAQVKEWSRRFQNVPEDQLNWSKTTDVVVIKVEDDGCGSHIYTLPSSNMRTGPIKHKLYSGVKVAKSFSHVGGAYWFITSRGTDDDEMEAPFEYVTAVREPDKRIVREYVPFSEDELIAEGRMPSVEAAAEDSDYDADVDTSRETDPAEVTEGDSSGADVRADTGSGTDADAEGETDDEMAMDIDA